jgi:hypothetical protein
VVILPLQAWWFIPRFMKMSLSVWKLLVEVGQQAHTWMDSGTRWYHKPFFAYEIWNVRKTQHSSVYNPYYHGRRRLPFNTIVIHLNLNSERSSFISIYEA